MIAAVALAVLAALLAAPALAGLSVTVPDRGNRAWYRGAPTGWRRRLVLGAASLGTCVPAAVAAGWTPVLAAWLWLALVLAALGVIDVEHHRLPDRLVGAGYLGGAVLLAVAAGVQADAGPLRRAALAALALLLGFGLVALAVPSALGLGDVKLAGLLAGFLGWLSWTDVFVGLFAGFLLGALVSLGLLAAHRTTMRTEVAFGPSLIVGALLVAAWR